MKRIARLVTLAGLVAALAGCAGGSASSSDTMAPTSAQAALAPPAHIVLIMLENKPNTVLSQMPYLSSLAGQGVNLTNYWATNYPSLPNYIALTSGSVPSNIAGHDCAPSGSCTVAGPSIFGQLGTGWQVWAESEPTKCGLSNSGLYAPRHTAAPYYTAIRAVCQTNQVPLPAAPNPTARFTLVAPNLCHDAHDCSATAADTWLKGWLPTMLESTAYTSGSVLVEVTFDSGSNNCGASCASHVAAVLLRAGLGHATPGSKYTHYSLLRLNEELLGLPLLGKAASAADMRAAAGL